MAADAGRPVTALRVDGGASKNDLLVQLQADLLDARVDRPRFVETTALGAAYLAGVGAGVFSGLDDVKKAHAIEREFEPAMSSEEREKRLARWTDAVERTRSERA